MQKYTSIEHCNLPSFRHIIAGAFFQMEKGCLNRIREVNMLASSDILYVDVSPDSPGQQLLLCSIEREGFLRQLKVRNYLSVSQQNWPQVLKEIRKLLTCENGIYRGPFLMSGLTETSIDLLPTRDFLTSVFSGNMSFNWQNHLGYYFPLRGEVVYGNQVGRKLGYPTLNIKPADPRKLIPPMGVYTGFVHIGSNWYRSMINIGIRPTLDLSQVTIEAHVFDFSDEIYGVTTTIHFTGRIRDEMRFASLEDLKKQLKIDQKKAIEQLDTLSFRPGNDDEFLLIH